MDQKKIEGKEVVYLIKKDAVLKSILKTAMIFIGVMLVGIFLNGFSFEILLMATTIFSIMVTLQFVVMRKYKVNISENQITFHYHEAKEYNWQDISMMIIGEVEQRGTRTVTIVYGIQLLYSVNFDGKKEIRSDIYI